MSNSSDLRSAVIAATASVVVGVFTFLSSSCNTQEQLKQAELGHSNDVSKAFQQELDELFNADEHHVQVAFAAIYFLGENEPERKQIILTAGSSRTAAIRNAIAGVLPLDSKFGSDLWKDPQVLEVLEYATPTPSPTPSRSHKTTVVPPTEAHRESPAHLDNLDKTLALLNGVGWTYVGLGTPDRPGALLSGRTIANSVLPPTGTLITFTENVNMRSTASPDGDRIGVVQKGAQAAVLASQSESYNNKLAYWLRVFLCNAPPAVKKPPEASSCPQKL